MKAITHILFGLATTVLPCSVAADPVDSLETLPECGTDIEIQFFNAYIDIANLPPSCNKKNVLDIGFLVQDVVETIDNAMPGFQGETMHTTVCPLAQQIGKSSWGGVQRFAATGRAERCKSSNSSARRLLQANSPCSLATRAKELQRKVEYAVSASIAILRSMMERAGTAVFDNLDLSWNLERASEGARVCQEAAADVALAASEVTNICNNSSRLEKSQAGYHSKAKVQYERAVAAVTTAKKALSQTRQAQHKLNVLYYVKRAVRSQELDLIHRSLSSPSVVCATAKEADGHYQDAKDTVEACRSTMNDIQSVSNQLGTKEAKDMLENAKIETSACENHYEAAGNHADKAQFWCNKAKNRFQKNQPKHAQRESDAARSAADESASALALLREYQADLRQDAGMVAVVVTLPPTTSPTVSPTDTPTALPTSSPTDPPTEPPTNSPTSSPTAAPSKSPTNSPTRSPTRYPTANPTENTQDGDLPPFQELSLETDYLTRLSSNLESSDGDCEQVAYAVQQKTLAEEALLVGHTIFDEIAELSLGREENENVKNVRVDAFLTSLKIKDESAKASAAADMASDLCGTGQLDLVQAHADIAAEAANQTRLALDDLRVSRDVMEDAIALMGFDPALSGLDSDIEEDEIALLKHSAAVDDMLTLVNAQIAKLPDDSAEIAGLEMKQAALEQEQLDIQKALAGEIQFQIGNSALKKDEYYKAVSPDFDKNPPLKYVLQSSETNETIVEHGGVSKEEYFRNFGESVTSELLTRLTVGFRKKNGGCILGDTELSVVVVITEITSFWEQFVPAECETLALGRGPPGRTKGPRW